MLLLGVPSSSLDWALNRGGLEGQNYVNERPMHERKFAFLSTAVSGELQLDGYDRKKLLQATVESSNRSEE